MASDVSASDSIDQRLPRNQLENGPGKPLSPKPSSNKQANRDIEELGLLYDPTDPNYCFLQAPKIQTILPQDLEFLSKQGCFIVPQRSVLDEFIQHYFSFIHPILPILNEADFWAMYNSQSDCPSQDRISIIVLQGMLFTSCTFVSEETLKKLGFQTTQDAKYSFYRRAKLLYDFGYERSSISIAQAAVLLSHSHLIPLPYGGYKQLGSLWSGIAIHHARDARAHRYFTMTLNNPQSPDEAKKHNVLKRLWWCCIICDRVIPLTSRQNIKITRSNFNFDASPILRCEDLFDEFYNSNVYDSTTKIHLAQVLEKLVELCIILTDVLTLSSSIRENPSWDLSQRITDTNQAGHCRIQLQRWYNAFLEMKSARNGKTIQGPTDTSPGSSVILFTNLAEMYYHSARLALCHYEMMNIGLSVSPSESCKITNMLEKSYELQNAISQVTECLAELTRLRLIRWLPMSAVGCTALPLALQILDVELLQLKSQDVSSSTGPPVCANRQQERLNMLIDAMKTYRPRYYIVDWVASTIRHIVNVAQQWLPSTHVASSSSRLSVGGWIEILQAQPSCYLRLAMTMDLSISNGQLPEESDFPPGLRDIVQRHMRTVVSPTSIPTRIDHIQRLHPRKQLDDDGARFEDAEDESTPGFPSEDDLFDEESAHLVGNVTDFDGTITGIPGVTEIPPPAGLNGTKTSSGFNDVGTWPNALCGLNANRPFPSIQPVLGDFQTGNDLLTQAQSMALDPAQWVDGQPNNELDFPDFRMDESFLEIMRETAGATLRNNDERLLEQLDRAINMP
ncbi:hypothetical protein QQX98_003577 [Neonectria punicea]|uniref:Xylanolytic transcriptional activator regulatory domain-containing protein n=1 Tax=Neonectria punicea TaxID=979145 RepID=A0ABR1HDR7_9HYPO